MAAATGREAICHCESYVDGCMPVVAMPNAEDLTRRLADLLSDPRETLGVELKVWLDIVDNAEHTGRQISTYAAPNYGFLTQNISHQDVHRTSVEIQVDRIADELPELVDSIIRPLYELFDFFTLPATLCDRE